jgi:glycosyltransferase involved in cell wall biosynthesis
VEATVLLGVPTLNRYELLAHLLDSAERGSMRPSGYVIVDNGGTLPTPTLPNVEVIRPERNVGVAASWNRILERANGESVIIANDDVTLGHDTFRLLVQALDSGAIFVECGLGWALFGQSAECTRRVGPYDEKFYPAYYEDNDYAFRMRHAGIERTSLRSDAQHVRSATLAKAGSVAELDPSHSRAYYLSKWGGLPGQERYSQPFGNTPKSTRSITVVVQAPPQSRPGWEQVRQAIEASDIGTNYDVMFQRPEHNSREHFLAVLDRLAAADTDLVLRLEDDVDVNRHILYNLSTWPELDDPRFGVGWVFDAGGSTYSSFDRKWRKIPTKCRWTNCRIAYSQGTLIHRRDVPWIRERSKLWFDIHPGVNDQDLALSEVICQRGKWICIHAPSLLEHRIDLPSMLNHGHSARLGQSSGAFFKDWRRGDPVVDQYGRVVAQR